MELSRFIGNLKTTSSRRIHREFSERLCKFFRNTDFGSNAYAVVSMGGHANIEKLLEYIQNTTA